MVKRKCGTCRFFRDAEIACSGWCTHPERGDLHDLVLVRRAELACRNSWDNDLWEPAQERSRTVPSSHVEPATPSRPAVPDNPTDRVTSIDIARPAAEQQPAPRHPAVAGGQESRRRESPTTVQVEAGTEPRRSGVSSLEPSFARALPGPSRDANRRTTREDGAQSSPEILVTPERRDPQPPAPRFVAVADRGPEPVQRADDTTPLPVDEVNRALEAEAALRAYRSRPTAPVQEPDYALSESTGGAADGPVIHVDGLNREAGAERDTFRPAEAMPAVSASGRSPLDETSWVAGIPRCCDTCREFHRDPSGKQGYCRSPYAFSGRTMVQSDQLACRSSIGVWWLPNDDTWLEKADIAHHTRPTPYLDAILADLRPETR